MERVFAISNVLRKMSAFTWLGLLIIIYLFANTVLPVSNQTLGQLHLSESQYRMVLLSIIMPYCIIWVTGFYAYITFNGYTRLIDDEREMPAFRQIGFGLQTIAWGLAVPAVINTFLKALGAAHPNLQAITGVISAYLTLAVSLIAFTFIGLGARYLSDLVRRRPSYLGTRLMVFGFIAIGITYSYLTVHAQRHNGNPYHLSLFATLATIVVPYLYAWFLGFLACYELSVYARHVKGVLYKNALNQLGFGISLTVISSIFIQYITTIYANNLPNLAFIIFLLYIFLALEGIGFMLIATGAKRLKKIEEI